LQHGRARLPHIIDSDKLTGSPSKSGDLRPWQRRAVAVEEYLAAQWNLEREQVHKAVDKLMRRREYAGKQRQNSLGIVFEGLVKLALASFGNPQITYELDVAGESAFPGVDIPTRTEKPFIDILARKEGRNVAIISTKWSVRHDRVNDLTNECRSYKNAAREIDRKILYFVATNEFDPARLEKIVGDKCIDAVAHVHKPLVTEVCGLNGRLENLLDLSALIEGTRKW